jgi:hypothetical protein
VAGLDVVGEGAAEGADDELLGPGGEREAGAEDGGGGREAEHVAHGCRSPSVAWRQPLFRGFRREGQGLCPPFRVSMAWLNLSFKKDKWAIL